MKTSAAGMLWSMVVLSVLSLFALGTGEAQEPPTPAGPGAQRPDAWDLLSDRTLLVASIPNLKSAREHFTAGALSPLLENPPVRLAFEDFWRSCREAFPEVEGYLGEDPLRVLQLLDGECCVALCSSAEQPVAVVAWVDFQDQVEFASRVHERLAMRLAKGVAPARAESVRGTEIRVYPLEDLESVVPLPPWLSLEEVCLFQRGGVLVIGNSVSTSRDLLDAWDRVEGLPGRLSSSPRFERAMAALKKQGADTSHVTWYADPYSLAKQVAETEPPLRGVLNIVNGLGAKGVVGVAGNIRFGYRDLDSLARTDLTLESPRTGILDLVALEGVETTPESWVPAEAESYTTLRWNIPHSLTALRRVLTQFFGSEDLAESTLRSFAQPGGVNLLDDVFPLLTNRFSRVGWLERPIRPNSVTTTLGMQLTDAAAFKPVLRRLLDQHGANVVTIPWGAVEIHQWTGPQFARPPAPPPRRGRFPATEELTPLSESPDAGNSSAPDPFPLRPGEAREPTWCCAIVNDYLLLSDSLSALKRMIDVSASPNDRLDQNLDFKLVASRAARLAADQPICLFQYSTPEEGLRGAYEFLTSPEGLAKMASSRADNRILAMLQASLRRYPLPPFETIARRLAPNGAFVTSGEAGIHYQSFSMKRQP